MIPAIIPARGGSKGIPRKNVRMLGGKPLIAWSIEQALAARHVTHVIVSTDDDEIADVASQYGASVFWRSWATATDTASSETALREVVANGWQESSAIVFLQATSPIRQPREIDTAIEMITSGEADSVFSARRVEGYTWKWGGGVLSPNYLARIPRQQQTTWTLEENGSIYAFHPTVLLVDGNRLGRRVKPMIMHPLDSYQIDELADLELMEQLLEVRRGHHSPASTR